MMGTRSGAVVRSWAVIHVGPMMCVRTWMRTRTASLLVCMRAVFVVLSLTQFVSQLTDLVEQHRGLSFESF